MLLLAALPAAGPLHFLLAVAPAAGAQQGVRTGRADYRISARLDGPTKRLRGEETILWTNESGEAASDLWFHLYLNAFANNRSTHLQEARGVLRGTEVKEGWGWSRVLRVAVSEPGDGGARDVTASFRYRRPDDSNEEDRTVFSVDLPEPVESGFSVEIHVEWEAQLPRVRRRTGYKDDFLLVAQWFPKLAVYEGGRGWNAHQFHANSEFYADYGTYQVTLDLPGIYENKTFATGVLDTGKVVHREADGGLEARYVVTFRAPSEGDLRRTDARRRTPLVHDFAWTADPNFRVHRYLFQYREWAERYPREIERVREALGPDADVSLRDVYVTVLVQPEHEGQRERHLEATSAALFFYGLWFGEYPYDHVTVVDPAWGARAAGGMEYPTLFTCGTRLFTDPSDYVPESVTVHEAGHQFWYGLVGNNEFEAAWLDEGFNSYADSEVLWRVYGPRRERTRYAGLPVEGRALTARAGGGPLADALALERIPLPLDRTIRPVRPSAFLSWWRDQPRLTFVPEWTDPRGADRAGYLADPDSDPIDTWSWEHADRRSYRANSYPRTAVALRTLPALVGHEAFLRAMREYSEEWRYRHPYPDDFFRTFQEAAGVELDWYFDEVFRSTATGDWSVEVDQRRRPPRRGFFQAEGGEFLERPEDLEMPEEERPWIVEVMLRRKGSLSLPMPLRLTFEDGSVREETWTREEQLRKSWTRIELETRSKLVSAVLDPARAIHLDADMSNNQWFDESPSLPPLRFGERVLVQLQHYLHWIGGVGG